MRTPYNVYWKEVFFPFSSEKGEGEGAEESWDGGEPGNVYFMFTDIVLAVSSKLWGLEWQHRKEQIKALLTLIACQIM